MQIVSKGMRATQLYLPNNPVTTRRRQHPQLVPPDWQATDDLIFASARRKCAGEDHAIYSQEQRETRASPGPLQDGVRSLSFTGRRGRRDRPVSRGVCSTAQNLQPRRPTSSDAALGRRLPVSSRKHVSASSPRKRCALYSTRYNSSPTIGGGGCDTPEGDGGFWPTRGRSAVRWKRGRAQARRRVIDRRLRTRSMFPGRQGYRVSPQGSRARIRAGTCGGTLLAMLFYLLELQTSATFRADLTPLSQLHSVSASGQEISGRSPSCLGANAQSFLPGDLAARELPSGASPGSWRGSRPGCHRPYAFVRVLRRSTSDAAIANRRRS